MWSFDIEATVIGCNIIIIIITSNNNNNKSRPVTRHGRAWEERVYSSYSLTISVLDRGERSASRSGRALAGERASGTHCIGGWVGPSAGLDTEARGKILSPLPGIESRSPGRPARSQTLYWLNYPAPNNNNNNNNNKSWKFPSPPNGSVDAAPTCEMMFTILASQLMHVIWYRKSFCCNRTVCLLTQNSIWTLNRIKVTRTDSRTVMATWVWFISKCFKQFVSPRL
jgi:hypothetical protein